MFSCLLLKTTLSGRWYCPLHRRRDWGSGSSQNNLADTWQSWCSDSCVFGSSRGKYKLVLPYQPSSKNKIQTFAPSEHTFFSFPLFSLLLFLFPFLLCCVLTCIWDPYSLSCLDQSMILKLCFCVTFGCRGAYEQRGPHPTNVLCTRCPSWEVVRGSSLRPLKKSSGFSAISATKVLSKSAPLSQHRITLPV